MKTTWLPDAEPRPRRVAVGTFDGVHLGHREVIRGADTVLTFDHHQSAVVSKHGGPPLLTTLERKADLIASLGVEELVIIPFDGAFAHARARSFVDDVLVGTLQATHVSVGENFRFGHRAQGDPQLLAADGRFEVRVVELQEADGEIGSSSPIRGSILGGAAETADRLRGEPFLLSGEVVHGDKRGRDLGYPTANLIPPEGFVVPGHGVYAACADGHPAAVNGGVRPQFQPGRGELIEAYLLDFDGDLYGKRLPIQFLKRLRGERRFPSVEALVEQMSHDVEEVRALLPSRTACR